MIGIGLIELVVLLALFLVWIPPVIRIIQKAGYSWGWFLLALIPVINLVALWVFAFSKWPSQQGDT